MASMMKKIKARIGINMAASDYVYMLIIQPRSEKSLYLEESIVAGQVDSFFYKNRRGGSVQPKY
jgi:hypothetical protein